MMMQCVTTGTHIHIVHNLHRDMSEMLEALKNWIPLYMTGMVDSYYCTQNNAFSFSHTMFLCPGVACIHGTQVRSTEEKGIYYYDTEAELLTYMEHSFHAFVNNTQPLIQTFHQPPANVGLANVIILPEEMLIREETSVDGFRKVTLPENPVNKIRIMIGDRFVSLTHLPEPQLTFYITNPLLCKAFQEFSKTLG